jgi:ectoine hydroxylase-related dioxygenase (phytanoyl-CoA dioxygenase family)
VDRPVTTPARQWFLEHGWWVGERLFDAVRVAEITRHFDDVVAGNYATGRAPLGISRFGSAMVKVSNAWWADPVIANVVRDPRIAYTACELLGVDEVYLWADSLYWKAPGAGEQAVIGWHQDKQYWGTSSTDDMVTACVALYPASAETGGLRFASGSHRWGLVGGSEALEGGDNAGRHGRPPIPEGCSWREVCPQVPAGGVTYHHALTFHGSGPNRMRQPRRSITIHMVSGAGRLVNWEPVDDGYLSTVGLGNFFRGPRFPRLWP